MQYGIPLYKSDHQKRKPVIIRTSYRMSRNTYRRICAHTFVLYSPMWRSKKRIPCSPALLFPSKLQLEEGSLLQRLFEIFHCSTFVVETSKFFTKYLKHSDLLRLKNNKCIRAYMRNIWCKTKKNLIYLSFPFQYIKMRKTYLKNIFKKIYSLLFLNLRIPHWNIRYNTSYIYIYIYIYLHILMGRSQ